jgi:hypothetical protein
MSEFRVIGRKIKRGLDLVSAFAMRCTGAAFVRVTGQLGSKAEGRLTRWPKSPIAATAFRR